MASKVIRKIEKYAGGLVETCDEIGAKYGLAVVNDVAEFGIEVDDLWGVVWSQNNADDIRVDNKGDAYHYNGKGYDLLAKSIADSIRKAGGFDAKK